MRRKKAREKKRMSMREKKGRGMEASQVGYWMSPKCEVAKHGIILDLVSEAPCDEDEPIVICDAFCTEEYSPHCGSDGKTYGNKCYFEQAVCVNNNRRQELKLKGHGRCEDILR